MAETTHSGDQLFAQGAKDQVIACKHCGEPLVKTSRAQKYHPECFVLARKRPRTVVGIVEADCATCGTTFVKVHSQQKFCQECGFSKNAPPKNKVKTITCVDCGVSCVRDVRAKRCVECAEAAKVEYQKQWRSDNNNKLKDDKRRYHEENADKIREKVRAWRADNPEKRREQGARLRQDPRYRLRYAISNGIRFSLLGNKKGRSWEKLVGYTVDDLMRHLERQFLDGMTWENYGPVWHVDHILADSSFNYTTPECPDFRAAWALTNLRPLWANDNIRKNAKRLFLI